MSEENSEYMTDSELSSEGGDQKKKSKKEKKQKKKKHEKKETKDKSSKELKKAKSSKELKKSKSKKKLAVPIDPELEDGLTDLFPKNPDGSLWKSPLKFWTNKPKKLNEPGAKIIMFPERDTDIFCRTINATADNPHFYWHKVEGEFNCLVKIKGTFGSDYSKAGILLRQDDRNWVMSGLEYYGGRLCFSTSITRNISDWSLSDIPGEQKVREEGVWIAVKRQEGRVACYYSFNLEDWIQTRMGVFEVDDTIKVGLAAACPQGDPFKVVFERFSIQGTGQTKK